MTINRNTYEEFFLLYVDNELTAAERKEVEDFIAENPDLKAELEMLQETVMAPEMPVMMDKDLLFRNNQPVNEQNYEEYFVLYGDEELNREQKEYVEQFVYRHPRYQAEFEQILKAKLVPETIVFENKEVLFRTEKADRPVVFMRFWKVAVAAAVLFFLGGAGWYFNQHSNTPGLAVTNPNPAPGSAEPAKPSSPQLAEVGDPVVQEQPKTGDVLIASKKAPEANKQVVSAAEKKVSNPRNISSPSIVQQERAMVPTIKTAEPSVGEPELIASKLDVPVEIVDRALSEQEIRTGKLNPDPVIDANADTDNNVVYVANTSVNKKNKLRGVFRKASRIFEKATNIDPSEGDRSVRIAGFEIALK